MAEAPKLNTDRYTGEEAPPLEIEIIGNKDSTETPALKNRYVEPGSWQAGTAEGTGIEGEPWKSAIKRGFAGIPGMPMEMINFALGVPKMTVDLGGAITEKAYNLFADEPADLPTSSSLLNMRALELPGGFADMKDWLGAPPLDPAPSALGRVGQAAIEGGLESLGPGLAGNLAKRGLPELFKNPSFLQELLLPSKSTLGKQLTMDAGAGAGAMGGIQYGIEEDSPTTSVLAGIAGALSPTAAAASRRGLSSVFGARDAAKFTESPGGWFLDRLAPPGGEAEAKARMMRAFDELHPAYRDQLATSIDTGTASAQRLAPNIDFTTGMVTEDPALNYLLSGARQRSGTLLDQAANDATDKLRQNWATNSPQGNVELPGDSVLARVEATVANMAKQRKAAEARALAAETNASAPAINISAETAAAEKAALAEDLHGGITSELAKARQIAGADIEAIKQSGAAINGQALEDWRQAIVSEADKQGQKGFLPDFLNPKEGGLNEELYPTSITGSVAPRGNGVSPGLLGTKPLDKDVAQVIGWDQVLRDQETTARLAGDSSKAHWAGTARKQLNDLLEQQLGSTGYTQAKKTYLDDVVKRFYTPTIDPMLSAKHLPANTGAKVVPTGPKGIQAARDVLAAVGDDPAAGKAFTDYTIADFASATFNTKTGRLDVAKANSWLKTHAPMIAELRTQATNGSPTASTLADIVVSKLDNVMQDQRALDEALAIALEREKAVGAREKVWTQSLQNKSAARFLLGKDPEAAVKQILHSPNLSTDAKAISKLLSKDPAAQAGLHQAIFDNLSNEMSALTAQVNSKNVTPVSKQISNALIPYQKLETAGALPKGFTNRAKIALTTEYIIRRGDRGAGGGGQFIQGSQMAQNDVSQFGRSLFGSRAGNGIAAVARDVFGTPEADLIHKILRDAALDPRKMTELLRAQDVGRVNLKAVLLRQAVAHGYKGPENAK